MVVMELIYILGGIINCCGSFVSLTWMMAVGFFIINFVYPGQIFFHVLTCVERYLAVVHPVTYLRLRQSRGVKIRNISTVCVWLFCLVWVVVVALNAPKIPASQFFCLMVFAIIIVSFCSLSVLFVLIRPGPGEVGGNREHVDQSKQRAFHTITAIMAVLCLWLAASVVVLALDKSNIMSRSEGCFLMVSVNWLTLPSSLVLPLLFLHRAGKLVCCH